MADSAVKGRAVPSVPTPSLARRVRRFAPVLGGVLALLLGAVLLALAGTNPLQAYAAMVSGAFGGTRQWTETILRTTPLLIIALGLVVAFRMRVWNIGAEGQYHAGALCGALVALLVPGLPRLLMVPAMLVAGMVGGMLWGGLAGVLRIKRNMNVIITTLMLNYVAILLVQYASRGPLRDPKGFLPESAKFGDAAALPLLFGSRLHIGVPIALLLVVIIYVLLWRTPLGFRLRAAGSRASVARATGINVERSIVLVLLISGALAGLAGVLEVTAGFGRLKGTISNNYGSSAILIALLGQLRPVGVLLAALLFSALIIGAEALQVSLQVPSEIAQVIQALVVLFVLAGNAIAQRD